MKYRIEQIMGTCQTNRFRTFYYPQVLINNKWITIQGISQGSRIINAYTTNGLVGWGDCGMAQKTIQYYKEINNDSKTTHQLPSM